MMPVKLSKPIDCPCCQQKVNAPSFDIVVDRYDIPPMQARILHTVWRGKGMPVPTERIFTAMYADDPDGGPSPAAMYRAFKVALCHLRKRLTGSGVGVENCGYRMGYRLVLGRAARRADEQEIVPVTNARRKNTRQQYEAVNG